MVLSSLLCPLEVRGEALGSEVALALPIDGVVTWRYRCGEKTGVIAENARGGRASWVPPVALAEEYPELQKIPVELTIELMRGGVVAERRQDWILLALPETVLPRGTLTVRDETEAQALCGSFVRGYSRAVVEVAAQGSAGAEIRQCRIVCGPLTGWGTRLCFDLPGSGLQTVKAFVTDSRGRRLEMTTTIPVLERTRPQGAILSAAPCDAEGTPAAEGEYLLVRVAARATGLPNLSPSFTLRGKGGEGTTRALDGEVDTSLVIPKADDLELEIWDGLQRVTFPYVPRPLVDLDIPGRGLGIGCRGDRTGTVSLGLPVEMGGCALSGLPEAKKPGDALPLGQAEGCFLRPRLLWENPTPEASFSAGEIPAEGGLFLIEALTKAGGSRFWEVVGSGGCLRAVEKTETAARPVTKKAGALVFGAATPGDEWAIPTRIFRLLPGEEEQ